MMDYLKPKLVFAAASVGNASSCFAKVDMDLIADILGEGYADAADKIFGMSEACEMGVPIDYYCKYTSVELGAEQGFTS